jgi:hypothetical protein
MYVLLTKTLNSDSVNSDFFHIGQRVRQQNAKSKTGYLIILIGEILCLNSLTYIFFGKSEKELFSKTKASIIKQP